MSVRIDPTVGRMVHFYSTRDLGWGDHTDVHDKPRAAIVADVLGPDHVNLSVIDRFGNARPMPSVRLVQDGETPQDSEVHWAEWMPYQKGRAAKQEQATGPQTGSRDISVGQAGVGRDPIAPNRTIYDERVKMEAQRPESAGVPQQSPRRPPPPVEEADLSSNETRPAHPKPLAPAALKDLSD